MLNKEVESLLYYPLSEDSYWKYSNTDRTPNDILFADKDKIAGALNQIGLEQRTPVKQADVVLKARLWWVPDRHMRS